MVRFPLETRPPGKLGSPPFMAKKTRKTKPKSLMQTDIKDLEVGRALRRLGNVRVTEWEFSDILPKVKEIAATEVDVLDFFKRTANLRVNDWEIGGILRNESAAPPGNRPHTEEEINDFIHRITAFLSYVTRNLVESPEQAVVKIHTPSPSEVRFRLILTERDASALIGHGGHTAAAIRNLIKETGARARFFTDLKILSHKEEKKLQQANPNRGSWHKFET